MYNYITHKEKPKQRHHRFHTISIYIMETNIDKNSLNNEFFFNKDGKVRMENYHQNKRLYVHFGDIWLKIGSDFDDSYYYINNLIQSMVGEVYKIRPFPTLPINILRPLGWERYIK